MAIASRKLRTSTVQLDQGTEVLHFQDLLAAPGQALALNTALRTLSHLSWQDGHPVQIREQKFTTSELYALMPLLQAYPYYCPYEALLASFETGQVINETLLLYRARLQQAQQTDQWDELMRPVRNVLSRARSKICHFGIEILAINETGYMLRGTDQVPVISEKEQALNLWGRHG